MLTDLDDPFDSLFDPADAKMLQAHREIAPERRMWQAVLLCAIYEAKGRNAYLRDGCTAQASRRWLDDAGADYRTVCDLAGFDPAIFYLAWLRIRDIPMTFPKKGHKLDARRRNRNPKRRTRKLNA